MFSFNDLRLIPYQRFPHITLMLVGLLLAQFTQGCHSARKMPWTKTAQIIPALSPAVSKDEVMASINRNHTALNGRPVLNSWRSEKVDVRVSDVDFNLPATISVQSPRNFRLLVNAPIVSSRQVDLGSNDEVFWMWFNGEPQVMTASHEDVAFALDKLEVPFYIHPDWLMEVLGVKPLDGHEFEMQNPRLDNGTVDLISRANNNYGPDFERVVRVDLVNGYVKEHLLQQPGGKIIALAKLQNYTKLADGNEIPLKIVLEWPDIRKSMTLSIRSPEANSPLLASNKEIWKVPKYGPQVDIGMIARNQIESNGSDMQALQDRLQGGQFNPNAFDNHTGPAGEIQLTNSEDEHPWARPSSAEKLDRPIGVFAEASSSTNSRQAEQAAARATIPGSSVLPDSRTSNTSRQGTSRLPESSTSSPTSSFSSDETDDLPEWARVK